MSLFLAIVIENFSDAEPKEIETVHLQVKEELNKSDEETKNPENLGGDFVSIDMIYGAPDPLQGEEGHEDNIQEWTSTASKMPGVSTPQSGDNCVGSFTDAVPGLSSAMGVLAWATFVSDDGGPPPSMQTLPTLGLPSQSLNQVQHR